MNKDSGRRSMMDLIDYLYQKDELNKPYSLMFENCQHFAKRIFDEIAESESLIIDTWAKAIFEHVFFLPWVSLDIYIIHIQWRKKKKAFKRPKMTINLFFLLKKHISTPKQKVFLSSQEDPREPL